MQKFGNSQITELDHDSWAIYDQNVWMFLLRGRERALLIDTGFGSENLPCLIAALTELPCLVYNTHCHADHIGGNGYFPQIYAHPADFDLIRATHRKTEQPDYRLLPLTQGQTVDLGGRSVEVLALPGHSPGNIALYERPRQWLFSGDILLYNPIYLYHDYQSLADYCTSLHTVQTLLPQIKRIIPSHGNLDMAPEMVTEIEQLAQLIQAGDSTGMPTQTPGGAACFIHRRQRAAIYYSE